MSFHRIVVILFMMPLSLLVNFVFAMNNQYNFWYAHYFGTGFDEHKRRVKKVSVSASTPHPAPLPLRARELPHPHRCWAWAWA